MTRSESRSTAEDRILEWVGKNRDELAPFLTELVEIETPTDRPETFDAIFDVLIDEFENTGFDTKRVPGEETGGWLEAWSGPPDHGDVQLLLGHADTVWPLGTVAERPPEVRNGSLHGPGTLDMKGGLTQMIFASRALEDLSLPTPLPTYALITSDEEIGSPESTSRIEELAARANRVFVLEPGEGPEGKLKIARKSVGRFTVTIRGEAAHAGLDPESGASAIEELGNLIPRLNALADADAGVTVNVGEVDAGLRPNVVAPEARAEVDVRAPREEDARRLAEAIRDLETTTPGTDMRVEGDFGRPPMERTPGNRLLWQQVRTVGRRLGMSLDGTRSGGGSDGNNSSQYAPTIDGMGAVGDGAHQPYEYVDLDALGDRVALLAACLLEPPIPAAPEAELEEGP